MKQLHSGKYVHVVKFFNMGLFFSIDYSLLVSGVIHRVGHKDPPHFDEALCGL
jgi:hypothetical protein